METLARNRGLVLKSLTPAEWDDLWNEAKAAEEHSKKGVQ
jgi:hypothetical protein